MISRSLVCLARSFRPLLRALLIPAAALAGLSVADARLDDEGWVLPLGYVLAYSLIYSVFAVTCHRTILFGAPSLPNRWGFYFSSREGRFFGWSLVIIAMGLLAFLPLALPLAAIVLMLLPERIAESELAMGFVLFVGGTASWYVMARASLVLPATAVDQRPSMSRAWKLTEGNGLRVATTLAIPVLFLFGVEWLLGTALGLSAGVLSSTVFAFGSCLLGAFEVAVLSVVFQLAGGLRIERTTPNKRP